MNHFYDQIDGWFTYQDLYRWVVNKFPSNSHFVELGIYKGRSTAFMIVEIINSKKIIQFDCIDSFDNWPEINWNGETHMKEFLNHMKPVEGFFNFIRAHSPEISYSYPNESLDFVFIDGDHSYEGVYNDIKAWMPKLKIGGIIAGHDYKWGNVDYGIEAVTKAVNDAFGTFDARDPFNNFCFMFEKTPQGFIKPPI